MPPMLLVLSQVFIKLIEEKNDETQHLSFIQLLLFCTEVVIFEVLRQRMLKNSLDEIG